MPLIFILGSLTALGPFSIDMYLPGFPDIAKDLHVTVAGLGLSLSGFLVGISVGQLFFGPLLDRFGRKKPLYAGLVLYIIASVGIMMTCSLNLLIILRFIEAVGSCAASVAAMAIVRDLFPVNENARIFSLLMLVLGSSPMVAPTIGSYVTLFFGWQAIFAILTVMGILILLAVIFFLPESYHPNPGFSLNPAHIFGNFGKVISQPQFFTYAFSSAMAFAALFTYISGSPAVFMEYFHLSANVYGWIFALCAIGLIGAGQINNLLLRRYSSEKVVSVVLMCLVVVSAIFLLGAYHHLLSLESTVVLLFIILCCLGFINPNAAALSLAPFSKLAGSASALMGASQLGIGAVASVCVSIFSSGTPITMAAIMTITSFVALIILLMGRSYIRHGIES